VDCISHPGLNRLGPIQKTIAEANAWAALKPALGVDYSLIRADVEHDRALLYDFNHEFFAVLRSDRGAEGKELVIVGAAGHNSRPHIDQIFAFAKERGFWRVRAHTMHPEAMLRMSKHHGTVKGETVIYGVL
jgi:hypothetical protein